MTPHNRPQSRITLKPLTPEQLASIRPTLHQSSPPVSGMELLDQVIARLETLLAPSPKTH